MTRIGKPLLGLLTLAIASTLFAQGQSPITYIYDELGRLVAVVDPSGDTATYTYDAVGNILSIGRHSSTQVSVVEFSPHSGPVGSSVIVYGTGFSTTPSQNTVKFNGVTATVSASTATQITTSVPSSATTGAIQVIAPGGSATSTASFTVTAAASAPTITGFNPTIGAPGTAVTVSGTNFSTTPANNAVRFNLTLALVSSSTATSIGATVPTAATSSHITVTAPSGKVVSTGDFFIPPPSFTATDVSFTGRMSIGGTSTATIAAANKVGLMIFEGTAGQLVSLKTLNSTITSTAISIFDPFGTQLGTTTNVGTGSGFVDTRALPTTGTYTILVDPAGTNTGSIGLNPQTVQDWTGSITPGGSAVNLSIATAGQNARLTFTGSAAQRISLQATNSTIGSYYASYLNPEGISLGAPTFLGTGSGFVEPVTLSSSGTYTLLVDPSGSNTGNTTLNMYSVPADTTGSIVAGGSPATVTLSTPGQNGTLTFSGTSGQRISLAASSSTISFYYVTIKNPDGSTLFSTTMGSGSGFIDTKTLGSAGTYTIQVDPSGANTGSTTLTLYNVPADSTGTITAGGSAVTVTLGTPGQNGTRTFSGTQNQRISLKATNSTIAVYNVSITNPDGSTLVSPTGMFTGSGFIDTKTLPATGTYTILVDPTGTNTGSTTLTLYDVPADFSGSTTINGATVTVALSTPGQNGNVTFSGNSAQLVTVQVTNNTFGLVTVKLLKPDGTTLTSTSSSGSSFNLAQQTLPSTGTYTINIDPSGANTGSLKVKPASP